jgi:hypothetical protein
MTLKNIWTSKIDRYKSIPTSASEKTEVLYGFEKTTEAIMSFLDRAEVSMNICVDYTWPSVAMSVEFFK